MDGSKIFRNSTINNHKYGGVKMDVSKIKDAASKAKKEIMDKNFNKGNDRHYAMSDDIFEIVYSNCLPEWSMEHSERMGLMGILHKLRPQVAIEIGTYKCGSLSLISQYSQYVFSIDIDESIPSRFTQFKNVSFLSGDSKYILPILINELSSRDLNIGFYLVDGDHSYDGVKSDINNILESYIPKHPAVIMCHDSFNPECRKGMKEANWSNSLNVHYVDMDFIPGRRIENGSPARGQLWGGLALAYINPASRNGDLVVQASSELMFQELNSASTPS